MEHERHAEVETLLENHRAFLRYLERPVGDRALAEDILPEIVLLFALLHFMGTGLPL